MSLFGDRAWWLPGWVGKLLPAISVEGDAYFAKQEAAKRQG